MENLSRPIKKFGNWDRLKIINENKITTEIIMAAKTKISDPKYKIKSGAYKIGNKEVNFELSDNIIFRTSGKIMEINYDPNRMPNKELMPQQIPNIVVDWFNEILRQNNFPKINFINSTDWTKLIVSYKLKNKVIAGIIYPKTIKTSNGYSFDFGDGMHLDFINSKRT